MKKSSPPPPSFLEAPHIKPVNLQKNGSSPALKSQTDTLDIKTIEGAPQSNLNSSSSPSSPSRPRRNSPVLMWGLLIFFIIWSIVACNSQAPSTHNEEKTISIPQVVGKSLVNAKKILQKDEFKNLEIIPENNKKIVYEEGWKVAKQSPESVAHSKKDKITLTVTRDLTSASTFLSAGMRWNEALLMLKSHGFTQDDYSVITENNVSIVTESDWAITNVENAHGTENAKISLENAEEKRKAEEERLRIEDEQRKAEAQRQAEAARRAAQEQARQQAAQQRNHNNVPAAPNTSGSSSGSLVATCIDGTTSKSLPGARDYRGVCSHHGGIARKLGRQ